MGTSIFIDFEGFSDIQKKLMEASSEESLKQINKKIIKAGQIYGEELVRKRMPKSLNLESSGPKRGRARTIPKKHAADSIPIDGLRSSNGQLFGFIGWRPSNNDDNFYAKFYEDGVEEHRAPNNFNRPVPRIKDFGIFKMSMKGVATYINEIGINEYTKKLEEVFGSDNQ